MREESYVDLESDGDRNLGLSDPSAARGAYFLSMGESLRAEARGHDPDLAEDESKILAAATYLFRDAESTGYKMRLEQRMIVFLIFDGGNWRSHSTQAYRYADGHWKQYTRLEVNFVDNLTALEGLFIQLAEEDLEWNWEIVNGKY